jgi:molybdate transport system substrate-binding protein
MTALRTFSMVLAVVTGFLGGFGLGIGEAVQAETLTVGAAPSMKAALQQILPMFESEYGAKVHVVYGPSQTLRRQIEKGAPIDVFLPAAIEEVEKLDQKGLTLKGGVRIYAETSLVLVMSAASLATSISFREVLPSGGTRIALGDPKTSSLGDITARALTKLAPTYRNHSHLVYAQHAEEIVNLLHTGEADVGIVYRVDAINSGHVRIIDEAPAGTHTPVQFGGAVVWTCRKASLPVAEAFLDFMTSPRIQKLLIQYGFDHALLNASRD